ncbi:hypothetical protein BCR35DRAFT_310768 [Leucosporidium creatinivorum]|uniref:DUF7918 domain-containing protein n=1 Tax=Leucosporidium creatinivorum TaxID=106004 RepID=A0A1Y2CT41_9BASI|nr:hypothetical protein BCR35DRAFT_310768 [Leucosporidium creatinivorum]
MVQPDLPTALISPLLPGCSAWVSVDGKPLPVYSIGTEGIKRFGYIEAVEGAHFQVHFAEGREASPPDDFNLDVYLDGRWVRGSTHTKTAAVFRMPLDHPHRLKTFSAARINPTTERPFLFSKIAQTDDDELACKEERVIKGIGSIQLRMMRIKDVEDKIEQMETQDLPDLVLHEQAKKVKLSHQTSLGPARVTEVKRIAMKFNLIDSPSNPFVNFEFRYRSRALLELEGDAPAIPGPRPPLFPADPAPPPPIARKPPVPKIAKGIKRPVEIIIDSDDSDDGSTEVERLRARVAELKRREQMKLEPATPRVKDEKGNRPKNIKREKGVPNGVALSASRKGKKGRPEVIELD